MRQMSLAAAASCARAPRRRGASAGRRCGSHGWRRSGRSSGTTSPSGQAARARRPGRGRRRSRGGGRRRRGSCGRRRAAAARASEGQTATSVGRMARRYQRRRAGERAAGRGRESDSDLSFRHVDGRRSELAPGRSGHAGRFAAPGTWLRRAGQASTPRPRSRASAWLGRSRGVSDMPLKNMPLRACLRACFKGHTQKTARDRGTNGRVAL